MKKRNLLAAAAGLLGTGLLFLPCPTAAKSADCRDIPRLARTSRFSPGLLPFSFNQVLSYFDDVFQKSGYRAQDHFYLFIEGGAPDELVTIAVYSTGRKIGVIRVWRLRFAVGISGWRSAVYGLRSGEPKWRSKDGTYEASSYPGSPHGLRTANLLTANR